MVTAPRIYLSLCLSTFHTRWHTRTLSLSLPFFSHSHCMSFSMATISLPFVKIYCLRIFSFLHSLPPSNKYCDAQTDRDPLLVFYKIRNVSLPIKSKIHLTVDIKAVPTGDREKNIVEVRNINSIIYWILTSLRKLPWNLITQSKGEDKFAST